MIFDEAGTYQIEYTATDDCGNETVAERTVIVEAPPTYRTVLYTDGTFIINESSRDEEANIAAHGQPTNVYDPFDPNGSTDIKKYKFTSSSQRPWHSNVTSVLSVEIGSNISPTSTKYWFYGMTQCTSMNLDNLNTNLVTDMTSMFRDCSSLSALDLSGFDTHSVRTMMSMFSGCTLISSLNMNNFNTSLVEDMSAMFSGCSGLSTLNVSGFNTEKVTAMDYMFSNCSQIASLDLSGFNTSLVTNMKKMLSGCSNLSTLNISNFDTARVTAMDYMFNGCSKLTSLDLSSFVTNNVTNMTSMFSGCGLLVTIYASTNYIVTQVSSSTNMFRDCTNLVGGAGTAYAFGYYDKQRAHIDGGTSDPGYFTAKS